MNTISLQPDLPTKLNIGCGADFREDCINIDINRHVTADCWIDLATSAIPDGGLWVETSRFGRINLLPGSFEQIILHNVLQQVQDLVGMVTACVRLLENDGSLDILVPYDLSYGAWADPANIRGFNEASFVAYAENTEVFGWKNTRLSIDDMSFVPTELGRTLAETGISAEEISRHPRAMHGVAVTLRKIVDATKEVPAAPAAPASYLQPMHSGPAQAPAEPFHAEPMRLAPAPEPVFSPAPVAAPEPVYSPAPVHAPATPQKQPVAFPGGWEEHQDKHCIWIATPTGYVHSRAFDDVAFGLHCAFEELGGSAPLARSPDEWDGRIPIIYGANLLPVEIIDVLPAGCILVNLEQISTDSPWISENYLKILNSFPVLDYSARNQQALIDLGVAHTELLEIGYSDRLTHIKPAPYKDIDVLFYGSMNERRADILNALKMKGLNVVHLFGVYGTERDEAIARAKIVLNMHALKSAIFEIVRVSYLLANKVCVLTEGDANDPEIQPYVTGLAVAPYERLVERCLELMGNEAERDAMAERGFEIMSQRSQADMLMETMNRASD